MVHDTRSKLENDIAEACEEVKEELALLVTPISCEPKHITVARQLAFHVLFEPPVLVSTEVAVLKEVIFHETIT